MRPPLYLATSALYLRYISLYLLQRGEVLDEAAPPPAEEGQLGEAEHACHMGGGAMGGGAMGGGMWWCHAWWCHVVVPCGGGRGRHRVGGWVWGGATERRAQVRCGAARCAGGVARRHVRARTTGLTLTLTLTLTLALALTLTQPHHRPH